MCAAVFIRKHDTYMDQFVCFFFNLIHLMAINYGCMCSKRCMILKFTNTLDSLEYLLIEFFKVYRLSILFKNSCLLFTSRFG